MGGPPVQPPAEEEPGSSTLLLWLHHQPFLSIWYLTPFLHRRREPTCELRKRPRKRLGSDKVDPPLSMCACVSFFLQDVNAEFWILIIRWPSFELEQKSSYLSSLLNAFVIVFRTIIIIVIVFDISMVIIILLCSNHTM